jgi:hypothetical protein
MKDNNAYLKKHRQKFTPLQIHLDKKATGKVSEVCALFGVSKTALMRHLINKSL